MALQLHSQTTRPTQDSDTHLIWNSEPLQKSHHTLLKVLLLKHRRTNAEPQVRLWPSSELLRPVQKTAAATAEPNLVILPAVDTFAVLAGYRICSVCSCKSIIKQHHPPSAFWGFHLLLWLAEPYNIHHLLFRFVEKQLIYRCGAFFIAVFCIQNLLALCSSFTSGINKWKVKPTSQLDSQAQCSNRASTESGIIFLRFRTRAKIKKETKLSLQEKPINLG